MNDSCLHNFSFDYFVGKYLLANLCTKKASKKSFERKKKHTTEAPRPDWPAMPGWGLAGVAKFCAAWDPWLIICLRENWMIRPTIVQIIPQLTYLSEDAWIIKKLLAAIVSMSLFKFMISNSHSSSSQFGDSNNREMSISCTSRGVASDNSPGLIKFKQNADIDSCSLWMIRTGSGMLLFAFWVTSLLAVDRWKKLFKKKNRWSELFAVECNEEMY